MSDDERSAEARAVAERALTQLLAGGAPTNELLIVLGGLVPPTLTSDHESVPAHLGTTDVDVLLVTQLTAGRDLGPIENALIAMEFSPEGDGWRWRGRIENRLVKIEFLCDLDDQPAEAIVTPAGCRQLRAVNLRGTGSVEHDHREITLDGPHGPVRVRIAALAGYLLSKSAAARTRGADKDYYDLAYVLLYNRAAGPAAGAAAINVSKLQPALAGMSTTFLELRERFRKLAWSWSYRPSSWNGVAGATRWRASSRCPRSSQILADVAAAAAAPTASGNAVPIAALITAGFLEEGETLISARASVRDTVVVLADGRLECGDQTFDSPSPAATHCAGTVAENGWTFWMADRDGELVSLKDIRTQYLAAARNASGADRHDARRRYWSSLLELANARTERHSRVSPSPDTWISAGAGYSGVHYIYETRQHDGGAYLYLEHSSADRNRRTFDALSAHRDEIEAAFGGPLSWDARPSRKRCSIGVGLDGGYADHVDTAAPPVLTGRDGSAGRGAAPVPRVGSRCGKVIDTTPINHRGSSGCFRLY